MLICLVICLSASYGDMVDLVVLLDVSESMFPYYDATVDYLLKDIIQEHLHPGDTFHLISFADVPEREIQRTMKTKEDVTAVLDRISLLHPLGQYTDLILALRYLYQYTSDLSLRSKKNILILTDGIHDPPPGSAYPALTAEQIEQNKKIAEDIAEKFKREGWDINLVEFPRSEETTADAETTGMDVYDTLADSLDVTVLQYSEDKNGTLSHEATGAPSLSFPQKVFRGKNKITIPFSVTNYRNESILIKLDQILLNGQNILQAPVNTRIKPKSDGKIKAKVELPEMEKKTEHKLSLSLVFSDNLRVFPRNGTIMFRYSAISFSWLKYVAYVLIAAFIIFLLIRFVIIPVRISISTSAERAKYENSSTSGVRGASAGKNASTRDFSSAFESAGLSRTSGKIDLLSAATGNKPAREIPLLNSPEKPQSNKIPLTSLVGTNSGSSSSKETQHYPIEMRVIGQNPLIGNRNIHWIGQKTHSIGGRGSSFIVFLYPVPTNIASLHFIPGKGFVFTPLENEFFPQLNKPLNDCINTPILLKTKHGEELTLLFHEWISPLERINRILNLTRHAGTSDYLSDLSSDKV